MIDVMLGWATPAAAQDLTARSETVAQLRHDLFGQPQVPLYQFVHVVSDGQVSVEGYVGLSAIPGTRSDLSVYALNVGGAAGATRWRLGSQQGATAVRAQTFDGGWVSVPVGRATEWVTWGGWARHDDLDDLLAGAPVGRTELRHPGDRAGWVIGAQVEGADGEWVGRQDGSVRVGDRSGQASLSGAVVESTAVGAALERAKGEVGARLFAGATGTTWFERRTTEVDTLLADDILPIFAPDGFDEVGVRVRLVGPSLASGACSYAIGRVVGQADAAVTHRVDAGWTAGPGRAGIPILGWRWRTGPGGAYHALSVVEGVPLGDATAIRATGALVPYHKGSDVWRLAAAGGADLTRALGRVAVAELGADASSDAVWALDVRAHAALTLEWR